MHYYIFTYHREYAAGAIGVIAASPEDAVQIVLEYGQRKFEEDERIRGMSPPYEGEDFYINKSTVFVDLPQSVERWQGVWSIKKSAVVRVDDSAEVGVKFYELHDG